MASRSRSQSRSRSRSRKPRHKTKAPAFGKRFRATDHPHRDFRGETTIRGVKWRV